MAACLEQSGITEVCGDFKALDWPATGPNCVKSSPFSSQWDLAATRLSATATALRR